MSENISIQYLKTPFGELILGSYNNQLCLCDWRFRKMRDTIDQRIKKGLQADYTETETTILKKTITQLNEYFKGERQVFDIPLLFVGSEFQKNVWNELLNIPFGKTVSYKTLSETMGDVRAIRAVASANGANAISIIVPCHRVIGSKGELTGYAGGINTKKKLLEIEENENTSQLNLFE